MEIFPKPLLEIIVCSCLLIQTKLKIRNIVKFLYVIELHLSNDPKCDLDLCGK